MYLYKFLRSSGLSAAETSAYLTFLKIFSEPLKESVTLFRQPVTEMIPSIYSLGRKSLIEVTLGEPRRGDIGADDWTDSINKISAGVTQKYRAVEWADQKWFTKSRLAKMDPALAEYGVNTLRKLLDIRCEPSMPVVALREMPRVITANNPVARIFNRMFPALDLRLGNVCNARCRYCLIGGEFRNKDHTLDEINEMFSQARSLNLEKVVLTGGEPTVRKDIAEIVSAAKGGGFSFVGLNTNALLLKDKAFLARLLGSGVSGVHFSLDTVDEKLCDHLMRKRGAGRDLLAAVDNIFELSESIFCLTVVNKLNFEKLDAIVDHFAERVERGSDRFVLSFDFISPEADAWVNREELVPRMSEVAPHLRRALERAKEKGVPAGFRNMPLCQMRGAEEFSLDDYMQIFQLVRMADGSNEYNSLYREYINRPAGRCASCRWFRTCQGFSIAYAEMHGDTEFVPVDRG